MFNETQGAIFTGNFPASSPYGTSPSFPFTDVLRHQKLIENPVTSVGATQFLWHNDTITSEVSASILTGAYITSGGGFSSFLAQVNLVLSTPLSLFSYFTSLHINQLQLRITSKRALPTYLLRSLTTLRCADTQVIISQISSLSVFFFCIYLVLFLVFLFLLYFY